MNNLKDGEQDTMKFNVWYKVNIQGKYNSNCDFKHNSLFDVVIYFLPNIRLRWSSSSSTFFVYDMIN